MLGFRLFRSFVTKEELFPMIKNILIEKNQVPESQITLNSTFSELGLTEFEGADVVMSLCVRSKFRVDPSYASEIAGIKSISQLQEFAEKFIPK
ncbi:unnamed protein product [Blepharisma stoltei]|uniref:Acyl carrier protein n=1 Tax=Blepharisma stoltei TaxID=1481888 RepID=A0AAU9IPK5_9CILI|nr:unnamed protein product [Blepharisma stoltei]